MSVFFIFEDPITRFPWIASLWCVAEVAFGKIIKIFNLPDKIGD